MSPQAQNTPYLEPTGRQHLLLVEDDPRIADFVQRGLKAEGYAVEVARTGREALDVGAENPFHAIILDLGLPQVDGQQVCKHWRENGNQTPILMLTARDEVRDKVAGFRAGADDYLTKPFAFEELLVRIEALIRRRGVEIKAEPKQLSYADLTLDRESHEVRRAGKLIELSPKEYALLECFLRTPGKLISRARILEQVWGYNADPMTNVVDVYIRQLRRKLDEGHEIKLIKTVRGYGYKLDAQ